MPNRSILLCCCIGVVVLTAGLAQNAMAVFCTNGSQTDCNPQGTTINPNARFVDPNPPRGYVQCAGFINLDVDDVAWNWENNCIQYKDGPLFLRLYNHNDGSLLAGARLFGPVPDCWQANTGRTYRTDQQEGEGFVDNPGNACGLPGGVTLAWHENNASYCSCGRPGGGSGTCNDIFTANAANNKILYVGGNSDNHNYEATWGPPGPKNTCSLNNELVRLRIAIYAHVLDTDGDGVIDDVDNCVEVPNPDQANADGDLYGDACDNCIAAANDGQENSDGDTFGDACDNCPADDNEDQSDQDLDGFGDVCDCAARNADEPGEDGECQKPCAPAPAKIMNLDGNEVPSAFFFALILSLPILVKRMRKG